VVHVVHVPRTTYHVPRTPRTLPRKPLPDNAFIALPYQVPTSLSDDEQATSVDIDLMVNETSEVFIPDTATIEVYVPETLLKMFSILFFGFIAIT